MKILKTKRNVIVFAVIICFILLMTAASSFDLELSKAVANPSSGWAFFFEVTAEIPTVQLTAAMCVYLFWYNKAHTSRYRIIYCILCIIGSASAIIYSVTTTLKYLKITSDTNPALYYSISLPAFILIITAYLLITKLVRKKILAKGLDEPRIMHTVLSCVIAALITLLSLNVLKILWGRVRFRDILASGDTAFASFTAWFKLNGPNGNRSFPSGHTANCVLLLYLTYFNHMLPEKSVWLCLNYIIPIALATVTAVSRVYIGAHYLTDVLMGAAVTLAIVYFTGRIRKEI